ncbi:hypothetical protein JKP88DRAFT_326854 [Tribonema minus]|uniref:Uncharacterized protein n=1 Tax=Tribonema minus TaxID=303371 RepID=A0A835YSS9_9STRA|nr:hypothetical protein JKP88DRAFT_326854 [Tribonema minus]
MDSGMLTERDRRLQQREQQRRSRQTPEMSAAAAAAPTSFEDRQSQRAHFLRAVEEDRSTGQQVLPQQQPLPSPPGRGDAPAAGDAGAAGAAAAATATAATQRKAEYAPQLRRQVEEQEAARAAARRDATMLPPAAAAAAAAAAAGGQAAEDAELRERERRRREEYRTLLQAQVAEQKAARRDGGGGGGGGSSGGAGSAAAPAGGADASAEAEAQQRRAQQARYAEALRRDQLASQASRSGDGDGGGRGVTGSGGGGGSGNGSAAAAAAAARLTAVADAEAEQRRVKQAQYAEALRRDQLAAKVDPLGRPLGDRERGRAGDAGGAGMGFGREHDRRELEAQIEAKKAQNARTQGIASGVAPQQQRQHQWQQQSASDGPPSPYRLDQQPQGFQSPGPHQQGYQGYAYQDAQRSPYQAAPHQGGQQQQLLLQQGAAALSREDQIAFGVPPAAMSPPRNNAHAANGGGGTLWDPPQGAMPPPSEGGYIGSSAPTGGVLKGRGVSELLGHDSTASKGLEHSKLENLRGEWPRRVEVQQMNPIPDTVQRVIGWARPCLSARNLTYLRCEEIPQDFGNAASTLITLELHSVTVPPGSHGALRQLTTLRRLAIFDFMIDGPADERDSHTGQDEVLQCPPNLEHLELSDVQVGARLRDRRLLVSLPATTLTCNVELAWPVRINGSLPPGQRTFDASDFGGFISDPRPWPPTLEFLRLSCQYPYGLEPLPPSVTHLDMAGADQPIAMTALPAKLKNVVARSMSLSLPPASWPAGLAEMELQAQRWDPLIAFPVTLTALRVCGPTGGLPAAFPPRLVELRIGQADFTWPLSAMPPGALPRTPKRLSLARPILAASVDAHGRLPDLPEGLEELEVSLDEFDLASPRRQPAEGDLARMLGAGGARLLDMPDSATAEAQAYYYDQRLDLGAWRLPSTLQELTFGAAPTYFLVFGAGR